MTSVRTTTMATNRAPSSAALLAPAQQLVTGSRHHDHLSSQRLAIMVRPATTVSVLVTSQLDTAGRPQLSSAAPTNFRPQCSSSIRLLSARANIGSCASKSGRYQSSSLSSSAASLSNHLTAAVQAPDSPTTRLPRPNARVIKANLSAAAEVRQQQQQQQLRGLRSSVAVLRPVPITRNGVHQSIRLHRRTLQQQQQQTISSSNQLKQRPQAVGNRNSFSKQTSCSTSGSTHIFTLSSLQRSADTAKVCANVRTRPPIVSVRPRAAAAANSQQYRTANSSLGPKSSPARTRQITVRSSLLVIRQQQPQPQRGSSGSTLSSSSSRSSSGLRLAESIQSLNQQSSNSLATRSSDRRHRPANLGARFGLTSSTSSLTLASVKRVKPSPSPSRYHHREFLASGQQQQAVRSKEVRDFVDVKTSSSGIGSSGNSSCSEVSSRSGASGNENSCDNDSVGLATDYLLAQGCGHNALLNRKTSTAQPEAPTARVNNVASAKCHVPSANNTNTSNMNATGVKNILQVNNKFPSNIQLDTNVNKIRPTIDNQENQENQEKILIKRTSLSLADGENNKSQQLDKTANKLAAVSLTTTKATTATTNTLTYTPVSQDDSIIDDQMIIGSPLDTPPPSEPDIEANGQHHVIIDPAALIDEMKCEIVKASKLAEAEIEIRNEPICDYYDLEARPFARGKFAQVKRCINKGSNLCFAAKCIKKRRRLVDIRHEILLEIEALKLSYKTERIVKLYEVYETPSEMILVLEMAKGGELQRVLDDEEVIAEGLVKRWLKQILEGLTQLHDNDIAHLDIKPQNLLLTKPYPNGDIKLCDFGISRRINKDCEIREICGTPDYVAPEILSYDPITLATDMWSLGVLTYVLLSGYSPFGSENKQQTFCNITQAKLDFPNEIFDKISQDAIDFIRKLIVREPVNRLTSHQAEKHQWLMNCH